MKLNKLVTLALSIPVVLGGTTALAAQNIGYYSYNVPRMNGHSTTSSEVKTSRTNAVNNNSTNGGGSILSSWIVRSSDEQPVSSTVKFGDGQRITMPYNGNPKDFVGGRYEMSIGTGWTQLHNIHTSGYWSPDDK